jgi:hypothetical protein
VGHFKIPSFPHVFGGNPVSYRPAKQGLFFVFFGGNVTLRVTVSHWIPAKNMRE